MDTMFWVWLAVIAIALLIEIMTLDLVSIWFSFGAVIPFVLAAIGGIYIEIQIAVFVVVSALLIIFMRKYAQRLLFKNMNIKTNIDSLIGKKCRMLESADFEKNGSVKINDVIWTAVSENAKTINKGEVVEIIKVDGNKLIVSKIIENQDIKNDEIENNETSQDNIVNDNEIKENDNLSINDKLEELNNNNKQIIEKDNFNNEDKKGGNN